MDQSSPGATEALAADPPASGPPTTASPATTAASPATTAPAPGPQASSLEVATEGESGGFIANAFGPLIALRNDIEKIVKEEKINYAKNVENKTGAEAEEGTDGYGTKVITQLFLTYFFFCKSMSRDFTISSMYVYYTNVLAASSNVIDNMLTAATAPYGIKTLWGSMSDAIPCAGYHKRFYIIWGVSVAISCIVLLAILWPEGTYWTKDETKDPVENPAPGIVVSLATVFFFGTEYGGATVDSLTQARYTELMKKVGTPTIVSFVWFLISSCTLISAWFNLLIEEGNSKILLYLALPVSCPMLYPALMNWLGELPAKSNCGMDCNKVVKHGKIFAMSMVLACGALGGAVLIILQVGSLVKIIYYGTLGTTFIFMALWSLDRKIALPAIYMFLCSAMRLFFGGTLQAFYTSRNVSGNPPDSKDLCADATGQCDSWCVKNGPGFAVSYYQFVGNFVGAVASSVAVIIFEGVISKWPVRRAFWVTTAFQMFATCLELMILERWNFDLFGLDPEDQDNRWVDQVFFLVGTQAMDKIIEMLDFMPCNVLIGKLCPASMEATIFAVLAGSQNFGSNLAKVFGAVFVETMGTTLTSNGPADKCPNPNSTFIITLSGLSWARAVGGILLPSLTIPLTFVLLPDKNLNDDYEIDDTTEEEVEVEAGEVPYVSADPNDPKKSLSKAVSLSQMPRGLSGFQANSLASMASATKTFNIGGKYL